MLFKFKYTDFLFKIKDNIIISKHYSPFCVSYSNKLYSSYPLTHFKRQAYQMANNCDSLEEHVSKRPLNDDCEPDGEEKKLKQSNDNSQESSLVIRHGKLKKFAVLISYCGVGYFGLQK